MAMTSAASRLPRTRRFLQRSFDVVVASVALLLTLPVAALAGLAIKLTSPRGPVLVREVRVGEDGAPFEMLKFRTTTSIGSVATPTDMSMSGETRGTESETSEISGAQRVTVVGRILHKCSIDDLPRWWNVVRGDMSVVGPEPSIPTGEQLTSDRDQTVRVSPGLTGMWRASGR